MCKMAEGVEEINISASNWRVESGYKDQPIKNCPFCGKWAFVEWSGYDDSGNDTWTVRCSTVGCCGNSRRPDNKARTSNAAIFAWNTRRGDA